MDQKNKFVPKGVIAEYVGEAQSDRDAVHAVLEGKIRLLFISPESMFLNPKYRSMLLSKQYKKNLVALVFDEAHCVKTW